MNETMLSEIIGLGFVIAAPWVIFKIYLLCTKENTFQKILREGREAEMNLTSMKVMRLFDHPEHGRMVTFLETEKSGRTKGIIKTYTVRLDKEMKLELGQIIQINVEGFHYIK
jgi:hypothetical protein